MFLAVPANWTRNPLTASGFSSTDPRCHGTQLREEPTIVAAYECSCGEQDRTPGCLLSTCKIHILPHSSIPGILNESECTTAGTRPPIRMCLRYVAFLSKVSDANSGVPAVLSVQLKTMDEKTGLSLDKHIQLINGAMERCGLGRGLAHHLPSSRIQTVCLFHGVPKRCASRAAAKSNLLILRHTVEAEFTQADYQMYCG